jgi:hypothetical protein
MLAQRRDRGVKAFCGADARALLLPRRGGFGAALPCSLLGVAAVPRLQPAK